jgi:hypothetical protein
LVPLVMLTIVSGCDERWFGPDKIPGTYQQLTDFAQKFFNADPYDVYDHWKPEDVLNRKQPTKELQEQLISTLTESRTVLGLTNDVYFERFIAKLRSGRCTNILVLGGSTSCGTCVDGARGERHYPWLLAFFLNQLFPCARDPDPYADLTVLNTSSILPEEDFELMMNAPRSYQSELFGFNTTRSARIRKTSHHTGRLVVRHRVHNRAKAACGSSYASFELENLVCDFMPNGIDLVIMEFASNDLVNNRDLGTSSSSNLENSSPRYLEFLIKKLDSLRVSYLFLQVSFRTPHAPSRGVHGNAELVHLPVQKLYDTPTISLPKTFVENYQTFQGDNSSKFFTPRILRDSMSHLTGAAHLLATFTLLWNFQNDAYSHWYTRSEGKNISSFPNKYLSDFDWDILSAKTVQAYKFDETGHTSIEGEYSCSPEWFISDEGRKKYGIISSNPGASCMFHYNPSHGNLFALEIGFMKSYNKMGKFRITFLSSDESDNTTISKSAAILATSDTTSITAKSYILDGIWEDRSSQYFPQSLLVPPGTSRVLLENIGEGTTNGTKVKIMSIGFRVRQVQACSAQMYPVETKQDPHIATGEYEYAVDGALLAENETSTNNSASYGLSVITFACAAVAGFIYHRKQISVSRKEKT